MIVLKVLEYDGEGFLIIDDLVDSGDIVCKICEMYLKVKFVIVCVKFVGKDLVDEYVVDIL